MAYNLDVKSMSKEDWSLANCKERSLYILQNYSKTEKQLRDKLKKGGKYTDEIIDKTLGFLKKHHFIDDEAYAKRFIETHKSAYSKKVIKEKLYIKGIKKNLIDKVLEENEDTFDEALVIRKLLLKKCPDYFERRDSMDIKEKQKILAFLYRKGFTYDNIQEVMKCIGD